METRFPIFFPSILARETIADCLDVGSTEPDDKTPARKPDIGYTFVISIGGPP